jgi:hypothetical protein
MTITRTKTKSYTLQEVKKILLPRKQTNFSGCDSLQTIGYTKQQVHDEVLDKLCFIIKTNRYKIIGNYEPFSLVKNGYGRLKGIYQEGNLVMKTQDILNTIQDIVLK